MMRYTWKRILTGIVSLFLLATVTFFLVRLIPGSPFQRGGVSEQVVEAVEEEYGLNDPLIEQYLSYMGNLLKGDLGISYQDPGTSVEEIIGRAAPLTVSLGLSALIVSVIVGTGIATTSLSCIACNAFNVRSCGSPGPTPTPVNFPFIASLSSFLLPDKTTCLLKQTVCFRGFPQNPFFI